MPSVPSLRRAFMAASIAWAALVPLAPYAAARPAPARLWYTVALAIYGAGSVVCHQLPARSFHLWATPLPVCARCTGIYIGAALTTVFAWIAGDDRLRFVDRDWTIGRSWRLFAVASAPTAATLLFEWTTGRMPSNLIRAVAGAPLGALGVLMVFGACRLAARESSAAGRKVN